MKYFTETHGVKEETPSLLQRAKKHKELTYNAEQGRIMMSIGSAALLNFVLSLNQDETLEVLAEKEIVRSFPSFARLLNKENLLRTSVPVLVEQAINCFEQLGLSGPFITSKIPYIILIVQRLRKDLTGNTETTVSSKEPSGQSGTICQASARDYERLLYKKAELLGVEIDGSMPFDKFYVTYMELTKNLPLFEPMEFYTFLRSA
jgi:hypothetical protein